MDWREIRRKTKMNHSDNADLRDSGETPEMATLGPQKDLVCGMTVDPATARFKTTHNNRQYFFCCARCLAKFEANPEQILASPPRPMNPLVSLGGTNLIQPLQSSLPAAVASAPATTVPAGQGNDSRAYVCPMCPEVRQIGPGPCQQCGMAL